MTATARHLFQRPDRHLLSKWNFKSATLSALLRSSLFYKAASSAGSSAAFAAASIEFGMALVYAGLGGALAQAFRHSVPRWQATLIAMVCPPVVWHTVEYLVHTAHGTPGAAGGVRMSIVYSCLSGLLTITLMRHGAWLAGPEGTGLAHDAKVILNLLRRPFTRR